MTLNELRKWLRQQDQTDAWWVSVVKQADAEPLILEQTHPLDEVPQLPEVRRGLRVALLHVSQTEGEDPPWVELDESEWEPVASGASRGKRRRQRRSTRAQFRMLLQLGLLCVVLLGAGFFIVRQYFPHLLERKEEAAAEQFSADFSNVEPLLPRLLATIGRTEYQFFITNEDPKNAWPQLRIEVYVRGKPEPYVYLYEEGEVAVGETVKVPLRLLQPPAGEEDLGEYRERLSRMVLTVPGFSESSFSFR